MRPFHDLARMKMVWMDGTLVQKQPGQEFDMPSKGRPDERERLHRSQARVIRAAFRFKEAGKANRSEIEE